MTYHTEPGVQIKNDVNHSGEKEQPIKSHRLPLRTATGGIRKAVTREAIGYHHNCEHTFIARCVCLNGVEHSPTLVDA